MRLVVGPCRMPPDLAQPVAVLCSGGLDSAILLGDLHRQGRRVTPLFVRAQLAWEHCELAAVRRFVAALPAPGPLDVEVLDLPLWDVYRGHWSLTGRDVPDDRTPDEAVYLPGRNALLLVKACLWCRLHDVGALALGHLCSNPFPDATDAFFDDFQSVMQRATGGAVQILRPFARLHKSDVMRLGAGLPLEQTFSCLSPRGELHCGACNKCAERRLAFASVDLPDPTRYAAQPPDAG